MIRQMTDDQYIIKETTLYSAFNRLESNGYIESFSGTVIAGENARTYYRITADGHKYYREKCADGK